MNRYLLPTLALLVFAARPVAPQGTWPGRDRLETETCVAAPADADAAQWIRRARRAVGIDAVQDRLLRWRATDVDVQYFQSDRPAPPYIESVELRDWWFDAATGVERWERLPASGSAMLRTAQSAFVVRDTLRRAMAALYRFHEPTRALNPLAVLADWSEGRVRVAGTCSFRGYPRLVLERDAQRLYLDFKSAMPVKLERIERHATWGQIRAEYVYATWWRSGAVALPMVAVRYVDGVEHLRRNLTLPLRAGEQVVAALARADGPDLALPAVDHRNTPDPFAQPLPVDTVRVDNHTFLLTTRAYTHAVTLQRDTVYLLDATTSESRSRADSVWIATLFPRVRAVVLVVTDLAWPHVQGVRFWAARGATIVTHEMSRPFLEQLLARRWTLAPDVLEGARRTRPPRVITTRTGLNLAGGGVRLRPIDGVASEGALYVAIPSAGFVWAGDYIQNVSSPSQYAQEMIAAIARDGIAPDRVAAQHLSLSPWSTVLSANPRP